jgi:hypothetical protein
MVRKLKKVDPVKCTAALNGVSVQQAFLHAQPDRYAAVKYPLEFTNRNPMQ